ncbi:MAG TPA: 7TM diverse intracellular signaling domain-containing protein, partial [Flavobacterium sp.]
MDELMTNRWVTMARGYFLMAGLIFLMNFSLKASSIKNIEVLAEENYKYSIDQVINSKLPFSPYKEGNYSNKGLQTYWVRFLYDKLDPQKAYYITYPFIVCKNIDLYYYVGDSLHHYHAGINKTLAQHKLLLRNLHVELPRSNKATICWLHVESFFGQSIWIGESEIKDAVGYEMTMTQVEFFFLGLGFLAALFGCIFFIFLKDKMYLYYSIFSVFLILSRLTNAGYLFNYTTNIYPVDYLKDIYRIFSITSAGVNLAMLLYFHEFLKFYPRSRRYHLGIYSMFSIRFALSIIHIVTGHNIPIFFENKAYDLVIQGFLLWTIIQTPKEYRKLSLFAGLS